MQRQRSNRKFYASSKELHSKLGAEVGGREGSGGPLGLVPIAVAPQVGEVGMRSAGRGEIGKY